MDITPPAAAVKAVPTVSDDPIVAEHVTQIRHLHKRAIEDIIEIGRRLIECRAIIGHGNWLDFLAREFGWTDRTARNYINAFELVRDRKLETVSNLGLGAIYLLSSPSTPDEAKTEILSRAAAGEHISQATVKQAIAAAKIAGDESVVLYDWKTGEEQVVPVEPGHTGDAADAGREHPGSDVAHDDQHPDGDQHHVDVGDAAHANGSAAGAAVANTTSISATKPAKTTSLPQSTPEEEVRPTQGLGNSNVGGARGHLQAGAGTIFSAGARRRDL